MIRINLLPVKDTKKRRTVARSAPSSQVSPLTILIIVLLAGVLGGYYYFMVRKPLIEKRDTRNTWVKKVDDLNSELKGLRGKVGSLKKLDAMSESMLDIVDALDPEDRILWSEKLNQISDLIPENVYIYRLTVTEEIKRVETAGSKRRQKTYQEELTAWKKDQSKPKPEAPEPIYYPEVKQILTIYGIAYSESEPERIRLINSFWDNLKNGINPKTKVQAHFMDGFLGTITYGVVETKNYGGRQVADFSFRIETRPTSPNRSER